MSVGHRLAVVAASVFIVAACDVATPQAGWVFPSPQPIPAGAVPVHIEVSPVPDTIPTDTTFACPGALLAPVELVVDRMVTPPTVTYRGAESGEAVELEWSWGVSAFDLDGIVRIVSPTGTVLMSEGQVAHTLGGGAGEEPGTFGVCELTSLPQRAGGTAR